MDAATAEVLKSLKIDPATVPPGAVKLFGIRELDALGKRAQLWARKETNKTALAYGVETEHVSPIGVALRNLHFGPLKDHLLLTQGEGPYWSGLHRSLPSMYRDGVGVFVEGPKDALVLYNHGIPAAAFLGVCPTKEHLKTMRRYLRAAIWIRDNDPPGDNQGRRESHTRSYALELGLSLIEMSIPVKDPAELVHRPDYFEVIKARVRAISQLTRV